MLGDVPEDEAEAIRELLSEHAVDCYEVPASFLGLSPASIWLRDDKDYARARTLIDNYQANRAAFARSEYERFGHERTLLKNFRAHPFRFVFYLFLISIVIYFSLSPFLIFGK